MMARYCASLLIILMLAACGFRLQGTAELPQQMQLTWIAWPAESSAGLRRGLPRSLEAAGVEIVESPTQASAILNIVENRFGERVLSVSANNVPEELEVYHSVTFELRAGETTIFPRETITLTRDYTFDETAVLAKYREGEVIADALVADIVQQIRRRLAVLD
ncbi:MAG: hypothetical protein HKN59_06405 [Gammaproteobacteria bacterium]|nr:hypothetical protein [Gammaproteobacteria bacterium]